MSENAQPWFEGRMLGFDLETTSINPEEAHIVSFALVEVGGGEPPNVQTALVNPGVPIPEEASSVNGISDEMVKGAMPEGEAIGIINESLSRSVAHAWPISAFNERYDLTVADRAARRSGQPPIGDHVDELLCVDPRIIDLFLWPYRPGKRTLAAMCETYFEAGGKYAQHAAAHSADADAYAAVRLAHVVAKYAGPILNIRYESDEIRLAEMTELWESVRGDLPALHAAQVRWAYEDAVRFEEYLRGKGGKPEARVDRDWPVILPGRRREGVPEAPPVARPPSAQEIAGHEAHSPGMDSPSLVRRASDLVSPEELEQAKLDLFSTERKRG